jgi:hypothetical protein
MAGGYEKSTPRGFKEVKSIHIRGMPQKTTKVAPQRYSTVLKESRLNSKINLVSI